MKKKYLFPTGSDGCIYKSLIPIHPNDPEKNQRVVRSLLLKTVVSGNVRNGVALTVLDQDHIAVLGPPLPASKGDLKSDQFFFSIKMFYGFSLQSVPFSLHFLFYYHPFIFFSIILKLFL